MLRRTWALLRDTVEGFIADEALTRGAAIACYTVFSLAPLLVVVIAIAGAFVDDEVVRVAVADQLRALVGREGALAVEAMVQGAGHERRGAFATLIGVGILLLTASGVFSELQGALNVIWRADPSAVTVGYLVRARSLSIGLVAATGFLLIVSLLVSAGLSAFGRWAGDALPGLPVLLQVVNVLLSFVMVAALFAAIFKVLPDRRLRWRDVAVGALVTAALFTLGKTVIGWYLGATGVAANYGAAGALVVVLLWIYYSAQTFLLGAEFTRAWAGLKASTPPAPVPPEGPAAPA